MKRISNSDLLIGLTCPYPEVQEAYLSYVLEKWLTSKSYGPQNWEQVIEIQNFLPENLLLFVQRKIVDFLPRLIARTKSVNFTKIEMVLKYKWNPVLGMKFYFDVAYAALLNLDTYPYAGIKPVSKKLLVEKMQNILALIEDVAPWKHLFSVYAVSTSCLKAFSFWLQKQEKESLLDFEIVQVLYEKAKQKPQLAKQLFDVSLYIIGNFRGYMGEAVRDLSDFCVCYPTFYKSLESYLFKNFDRYFWKLNPYDFRQPMKYYQEMTEHLISCNLHFSIAWKMKIVQKMLNQADNRGIVIYLLDNLKAIYGYQIENVDEAYLKAIKTGLKKKEVDGSDVLNIVNTMASGPIFGRERWWKNFAQYPLAWQKTMVMVYSSQKLSEKFLANTYFALVRMNKENPWLFDDFEQLVSSILTKSWNIEGQEIKSFFDVFADMPYAETTASYIKRGFLKLLPIANDEQIRSLQVLKVWLSEYACVFDCVEFTQKLEELAAKEEEKRKKEQEDWKEIDRLLSKLR